MKHVFTNVAYANLYKEASYKSAIDSQAILWEKLELLEPGEQFNRVRCEDGYEGWISRHQLNEFDTSGLQFKIVTDNISPIFAGFNKKQVIREAVAGCLLPIIENKNTLFKTILPDHSEGWIDKSAFLKLEEKTARETILSIYNRYLGVPYFWGGKTACGLDCSGYMQLLHKLAGINIRRDSPMQFADANMVSEDPLKGTPGDLLFFAEHGDRITHVALLLPGNRIIHARGMVKINSLIEGDPAFDINLIDTFVAVKTFVE